MWLAWIGIVTGVVLTLTGFESSLIVTVIGGCFTLMSTALAVYWSRREKHTQGNRDNGDQHGDSNRRAGNRSVGDLPADNEQ